MMLRHVYFGAFLIGMLGFNPVDASRLGSIGHSLGGYLKLFGPKDFALVEAGAPKASVVLTGDRQVDADIAFFTNAVFRSTGVLLPVVASGQAVNGNRLVFKIETRGLFDEDDWSLAFPADDTLGIHGSAQSCRWALNRLLEDRLGVVFCLNGVNGTYYPPQTTFAVPRRALSGTASLKIERSLYVEDAAWMRALGGKEQLPGRQFYNHNMHNILPPEKYGEDPWREKLMPLLRGKRSRPTHKDMFWQPCFSAAECVPESVENIRAYLDAHPGEKAYSLTMNDCGGYCECDGCKAMNGGTLDKISQFGDGKSKSRSLVYFTWANAVAREIAKSHPRVVLGLLAYGATIDPPPFRLEPNLLVFLCGSIYQNGEPRVGEKRIGVMRVWSEKVESYGVWDYPYGPTCFVAPRVYNRRIADFFALKNGPCPSLNGYFGEGAAMFVGEGPKRYLYLKAMFDTKLDVAKTLDTWYRACVGEAAAPLLKAYYELWEDFWCGAAVRETDWYKGVDKTYMDFRNKGYLQALDEQTLVRADALAEKAHALAMRHGDAGQKARAERLYAFHRFYSARIRVCGIGSEAGDVPVKSATEAVRFFQRLPLLLESVSEAARQVERIRVLDEAEQMPKYKGAFPSFARNAAMNESVESKLNDAAGFAKCPEVAEAMKAVRENATLPEAYRVLLAVLAGKRGLPPLVETDVSDPAGARQSWVKDSVYGVAVTEKGPNDKGRAVLVATSKDGTWPAMARIVKGNAKTSHYFRFAARVRNTASVKLHVRMCRDALDMLPVTNIFEVEPGATRTMAVVGKMGYKGGCDRFFLIFNGLSKGESVEVDGLSLDDVGRLDAGK